jgi:chromatin remodeling complex protein RSC6
MSANLTQVKPTKKVKQVNDTKLTETKITEPLNVEDDDTTLNVEEDNAQNTDDTNEFKFASIFQTAQAELKELKGKCSSLTLDFKKLELAHHQDIKKVRKNKNTKTGEHVPTGFAKPKHVPDKLAKFIGVTSGSELTGPQITSAVWKQLKSRNLLYEKDKRVFRTNKEVSTLFNIPATVNSSINHRDENGFNFCNLQTYIAHALNSTA